MKCTFIFSVFAAIAFAFYPASVDAESEPLTLKVCQRYTLLTPLQECIDELLGEHEKSLQYALVKARNKLAENQTVQAFDEAHTAWLFFIGKECFSLTQKAAPGHDSMIANAGCHIDNITRRVKHLNEQSVNAD